MVEVFKVEGEKGLDRLTPRIVFLLMKSGIRVEIERTQNGEDQQYFTIAAYGKSPTIEVTAQEYADIKAVAEDRD